MIILNSIKDEKHLCEVFFNLKKYDIGTEPNSDYILEYNFDMYVFVDESGKFESRPESDFGVMVIVTIPDRAYVNFKEYFLSCFGTQSREIKANTLSFPEREKFLKYIGKHPEIKYSAFIYDHKATSSDAVSLHQKNK